MATNGTFPAAFWAKIVAGLASLITVAFLAWAGVVWTRSDQIVKTAQKVFERVVVVETSMVHIQEQLIEIMRADRRHNAEGWHDGAGERLAKMAAEIKNIRQQIEQQRQRLGMRE